MRASEIRYRRLFEAARDGVLILDAVSLKITDVNPFMTDFLGYAHEYFLGKELWEIGFFCDKQTSKAAFKELQKTGYLRYENIPLETKDGNKREVEFVSNVYDEGGHPVIQCNIRDITERRRLEAARTEVQQRYQTLFEYAPNGIIIASPDRYYLDANPSMCEMLGYTRDELIGMHASDIVVEAEVEYIDEALTEVIESSDYHREWQFKRKDGSVFSGDVMVTVMPDSNLLAVIKDLTLQNKSENERKVLFDIIQGSIDTPDLDEFLKLVHRAIGRVVYAENCIVMLHDPVTDTFTYEFWADKHDPPSHSRPVGTGFGSHVLRTGQPLLLTREIKKSMVDRGEATLSGTPSVSWIGIPLRTPTRTIGVLVLQHYEVEDAYNERDVGFLSSVGDQVALAIERKRTQSELEESEASFKSLFDTASDAILVVNEGIFVACNPAAEKLFRCTDKDILGSSPAALSPTEQPDGRLSSEKANEFIEAAMAGVPQFFEWSHRALDGTLFDAEVGLNRVDFGGATHLRGTVRDITARKLAEQTLALLGHTIRSVGECVSVTDIENRIIFVNEAFSSTYGYSPDELIGNSIGIIRPQRSICDDDAILRATVQGSWHGEVINRKKDGTEFPVALTTSVVRNENGETVALVGIAVDITARKLAEEARKEKAALLEAQINSTIDGILVVDETGKKVIQNHQLVDIFKIPRDIADDLDDSKQIEWVTGTMKDPDGFVEKVVHLYSHPDETSRDVLELKDGTILDRYSAPVIGKDDQHYGRIWTFRDITENKVAEHALRESELRLRTIIDTEPECVKLMAEDGSLLEMNPAGLSMIEADSFEEVANLNIFSLIADENLEAFRDLISRVFQG
ncbi:MAG: PAS domain S-box protein, partial [Acidobacteriota bacterium]